MPANLYTSSFKKITTIILFVFAAIITITIIGNYYEATSKKNIIEQHLTKRFEEFYNLTPNTIDMLFIGSSHSYSTFDPEIFDDRLKINSFQMGAPSQQTDSTYFTLREILNYQKPKIVIYEYYWSILSSPRELDQAQTLFALLKSENLKNEFTQKVLTASDGELAKYYVKAIRYQQNYFAYISDIIAKKISETKSASNKTGVEYYKSKGFVYCDKSIPEAELGEGNHFKSVDGNDFQFEEYQKEYLQKIISLCKEQEIELILVTAPVANATMDYIKNYDIIHNKMSEFAEQNKIKYIDYNIINKQEKILKNENFRDDNHLNYSGAVIVCNHFIDWLQ